MYMCIIKKAGKKMKSLQALCSLIFLICLLRECKADEAESNGVYIVYMGAAATSRNNHNLLLTSLVERKKNAVVHNYRNSFLGFAAHLTEKEANNIAREPGVVSVFPDPLLKLHTTRSWDFLQPDVAAPGVAILASWPDNDSMIKLAGKNSPLFFILSGTSMACPHVSGLAAMIKSQNPNWSPSSDLHI